MIEMYFGHILTKCQQNNKEIPDMTDLYDSRILIVDDHLQLRRMVTKILMHQGFTCLETASCRKEAAEKLKAFRPDLLLLDVMLPDGDGFSFMKELREWSNIPVLFLSAKDEDQSRLTGLGLGADDYITKPFLPEELILRMTAVLKRTYFPLSAAETVGSILVLGHKTVNFESGLVEWDDNSVSLTAKELGILKKLTENRGKIVTFDCLCQSVWGDDYFGYENTLMVHIRRLRAKIEEDPSHPVWLLTARGLGYRLANA